MMTIRHVQDQSSALILGKLAGLHSQEDEGWLTKAVELRGLCLDVQQHQRPDITHGTPPTAPLLRTSRLQVLLL